MITPKDTQELVRFMDFVQGNLARKAGRLRRWFGKFWARRYDMIPVSDEPEAQVARLRYILEHGCKENLVMKPGDWPGPNSVRALLRGEPLRGVWHDQTSDWEARRRGKTVRFDDFRSDETVVLEPLPCWQHLPPEEIQEHVRHMVRQIEEETAERHRRNRTRILGRKAAQAVHPHDSPESPKRGPRPALHAATREVRDAMKQAYRDFAEYFRAAAQELRAGVEGVKFPPGSFPPGLPYVLQKQPRRRRASPGCSFRRATISPWKPCIRTPKSPLQSRPPCPDNAAITTRIAAEPALSECFKAALSVQPEPLSTVRVQPYPAPEGGGHFARVRVTCS